MAAEGAIEERRLVDDIGAPGHRVDRQCGRSSKVLAAVGGRPVGRDLDRVPAGLPKVGQEPGLVLEAALADDVELRVVAHRALDEAGLGGSFELGQVLAGEVGDEVGG